HSSSAIQSTVGGLKVQTISSEDEGASKSDPVFEFNSEHLVQLANYFENEMTGQLKKKLWEKVDKDASSLIEANEMSLFLYYSFVIFIKTKFPQSRIPKKDNVPFNRRMLTPLKKWLLHYKVSKQGLSYEEFDKYFSAWIREYHRDVTSSAKSLSVHTTEKTASQNMQRVPREQWPKPSVEWERKLGDVALTLAKADARTKSRLWDKIDPTSAGRIDTTKPLALFRLLYLLVCYHAKLEARHAKVPKVEDLQPLFAEVVYKIRRNLPNEHLLSKQDFFQHFARSLKDAANE
ncbi:hypothetical protein RFI_13578, partial [Reticulomyxa filosa]